MPGIPVEIRSIDRSELYVADEVFLCGTGVQIIAVVEVDHRAVGSGEIGPSRALISERYFDAVRGRLPEYATGSRPSTTSHRAVRRGAPAGPGRRPGSADRVDRCRLGALRRQSS